MNRIRAMIVVLVFVALPSAAPTPAVATETEGGYICPPCAQKCDNKTYDSAGRCPGCGMTLVAKSEYKIMNVAIVLWDGVELLDFAGPGEVFAAAGVHSGRAGAFRTYTVSPTGGPITSQGFVKITPDFSIANCPRPDIIVLPGGGSANALHDDSLMAWIKKTAPETKVTLTVCTGAFLLAKVGLLDGLEATTHWSALEGLKESAPKTKVVANRRWVDNGRYVTSAGVSAGIDGALHVVARLLGDGVAEETAHYMEYHWSPNPNP